MPFVAGGAIAIFVSELTREGERPESTTFSDAWFREADVPTAHLWTGEPCFDWGD